MTIAMSQPVSAAPPATPSPTSPPAPPWFDNAAQWHAALGHVPLNRIVFNPPPGTATEQDLLRLADVDDRLCELVDGTLVEKPVGFYESEIAARLIAHLGMVVYPQDRGAITAGDGPIRMASGHVRMPDVSYVSFADVPGGRVPAAAIPTVPPTIAAEVLSPSNTRREIELKRHEYFASGTRLAWVLDPPTRTVAVFTNPDTPDRVLTDGDVLDGGDVLPGFSVPVSTLFGPAPTSHE